MSKEPIRILHVLSNMGRGGAESMVMNYYRNIDRSKVQFDFLLHRAYKSAYEDEIEQLGGRIYKVCAISPKNYFKYNKQLQDFFASHPEYTIVHSHLNALSFMVLKHAQKTCSIRIAHSHTTINPYAVFNILNKNVQAGRTIKNTLYHLIRKKTSTYATHYFACAEKAGEWLYGTKNKKIKVIKNAIDSANFTPNKEKYTSLRKELGIDSNFVIGHVGRFDTPKNHYFLLHIFKEIVKKDPTAKLVLAGDGHLRNIIEKEIQILDISNNVLLLGMRSDVPELLQAFDVFLFPSLYEGLPVTVVEAQASSLPVIASDTVTTEVKVTNLVHFMPLTDSSEKWAIKVLEHKTNTKVDRTKEIVASGYDIKAASDELQRFYLTSKI